MINDFRFLLERAARIHERHEIGCGPVEEFNVFLVLRSAHDEVNLHSRFLEALLDHRRSPGESRENLKDFLKQFELHGLDHDRSSVHREWNDIDIVICDRSSMQAVIIENKIWAADQPGQLQRYAERMEGEGYECHVLYLTPDGHEASEDSARGINYRCISYEIDLVPWLKSCQMRAYDEPALRESVAQYLRLVAKLTGKDLSEAYMSTLKDLCLSDDNLVLVHDLSIAMDEARVSLLRRLWQEIEEGLKMAIPDLPGKDDDSDTSEDRIKKLVKKLPGGAGHGLRYKLGEGAQLRVETDNYIFFGVYCEDGQSASRYRKRVRDLSGWKSDYDGGWPLWRYSPRDLNLKHTTRDQLALLANETERKKFVDEVVSSVSDLWKEIKVSGQTLSP